VPFEKIVPNAPDGAYYLLESLLIFSPDKRISVDEVREGEGREGVDISSLSMFKFNKQTLFLFVI